MQTAKTPIRLFSVDMSSLHRKTMFFFDKQCFSLVKHDFAEQINMLGGIVQNLVYQSKT